MPDERRHSQKIEYLADFPGADVPRDVVAVAIAEQDIGAIGVESASPLDVTKEVVEVNDNDNFNVNDITAVVSVQEDSPLDVSGATVTVTDDGTLTVDGISSTVNVQEETALDVSGAVVPIEEDSPIEVVGDFGGTDTLRNDYKLKVMGIIQGDIWIVESSNTEKVRSVEANGTLSNDGTLNVEDGVSGSGEIIGDGEIVDLEI